MLFEREERDNLSNIQEVEQYEYKKKFGFLDELRSSVRTDEEFAKFKGYIE